MPFPPSFPLALDLAILAIFRQTNRKEIFLELFSGPNINRDLNGAELESGYTHKFLDLFVTRGGKGKQERKDSRKNILPHLTQIVFAFNVAKGRKSRIIFM